MSFSRRLMISLAFLLLLPMNGYVMAGESKNESQQKPFYVGVFGGITFPQDMHTPPSSSPPGIDMKGGLSGGLKTGWVLPGMRYGEWFNWEFEYWYQNNRLKQLGSLPGANGHFHTFSSNFILRRPTGTIQPYVGLGPSLVYADVNASDFTTIPLGIGNQSATSLGFNFLVGSRVKLSDTFGMFVEYKRNTAFNAAFDSGRFRSTTNAVVVGLTWDFESITLP